MKCLKIPLHTKYEIIQKNPVKKVEIKLNELLKRWLVLGFISKQESYTLKGSDCTLSKAYGRKYTRKMFPSEL